MALNSDMEIGALETLDQVLNWIPPHKMLLPSIAKKVRTLKHTGIPRTLVCHDMMFGYLEDRHVQGVAKADAYRFFHWSHVDIFVYFSHKFVTIPPPCWIDAAHLHGVMVLGTIITESDDGMKICADFLKSEESYRKLAKQLANISKHHKFDGWLVNIENVIEKAQMQNLRNFVEILTKEMHETVSESLVIWYDSVITTGELKWQDELNDLNRQFFDACDGIFLNYNWKDSNLKTTLRNAGIRSHDVYAGIDVFGRGTIGNGGFNTNVALNAVRLRGLSAAIFAQGWTYEKLGLDNFTRNEYKFWSYLANDCSTHGPSYLPFFTSFCQGFGSKTFHRGKVISKEPWTNISLQHVQPSTHSRYNKSGFPLRMEIYSDQAYSGGGCLKLSGKAHPRLIPTFQLFTCSIPLTEQLLLTYTWQGIVPSGINIRVVVSLRKSSGQQRVLHLQGCPPSELSTSKVEASVRLSPVETDSESEPEDCVEAVDHPAGDEDVVLEKHLPSEASALQNICNQGADLSMETEEMGWLTRSYILNPNSDDKDTEVIQYLGMEILMEPLNNFEFLLGQIQLVQISTLQSEVADMELSCSSVKTSKTENDASVVTCFLEWTGGHSVLLDRYSVYYQDLNNNSNEHAIYIGSTRKNCYKVSKLELDPPTSKGKKIRFFVQQHLIALKTAPVEQSTRIDVEIE